MTNLPPTASGTRSSRRLVALNNPALTFDAVLALIVTVISAAPYLSVSHWVFVGSIVLGGCLVIRRLWPVVAVGIGTFSCLFILAGYDRVFVGIVIVPILVYSVARWAGRTTARLALAAGLFGSVIGPIRWFSTNATGLAQWALVGMTGLACAAIVGGAYLVGRRRREGAQQGAYRVQAEQERERLALAEQQQRSRAAATDERNRIARELHDIVAHSLSVIVVQAEGGKAMAAKKPEQAPEVLETIAETSRDALAEMRRMVGLLRSGDAASLEGRPGAEDYRPAPGLGDLAELVRKTSDRARLRITGPPPAVGQALGLTVYRIVQESLTNVLKHAGPQAQALIAVHYAADRIEVRIDDDGRGAAAHGDGMGHGLQGMQERVGLHAGWVTAGPRSGGGFTVQAVLPLAPSATAPIRVQREDQYR